MNYKFNRFYIWFSSYDFKWHVTDPANWLNTDDLKFNTCDEAEEYLAIHCV